MDIINSITLNPGKRLAKVALEAFRELQLRRAVSVAEGLQSNGTPTFDAYEKINKQPMLFFDTRMRQSMIANENALHHRFKNLYRSETLRLAFSGRLIAMKGAHHLIVVAEELRKLGRPFHLTICGDGVLRADMEKRVREQQLDDVVDFAGNLDFETELVPFVRDHVDIFVCCHVQGDPSCTYLETMGCGVPIAGYGNEAFAGVASRSGAGWVGSINDPTALARRIASVETAEIEAHSLGSLSFAGQHTVESEFNRRMEHTRQIAYA